MKISTKGRYTLRVLIDIAENSNGEYIPMKEIATRQNISLKYLEKILPVLVKGNIIEGTSGKGGGYRLKKKPSELKIGKILTLVEGDLAPVQCVSDGKVACENKKNCRTIKLWKGLNKVITDYLNSVSLADLEK